jgi:uncharacterized protein
MQFRTTPRVFLALSAGLLACLLGIAPAFANDSRPTNGPSPAGGSPPTEASIRELLELSDAHRLLDGMKAPLNAFIAKSMQDAAQGKEITPDKQAILDRMRTKMTTALDGLLSWDNLLPMYIKTYQASLTQEELDGMITFYKSPSGQAMIKKMPLIMQNIMGQMGSLMKPFQQRVQQIQQETQQEFRDLQAAPKQK